MALCGPQALAFMPAVSLAAFWLGGEPVLVVAAFLVPALFAAAGLFGTSGAARTPGHDGVTGLAPREHGEAHIDTLLASAGGGTPGFAVMAVGLDDFADIEERMGTLARDEILAQVATRLMAEVRDADLVMRLSGPDFGLILSPMRRADLETLVRLSARVQTCLREPLSIDGARVYVTVSIGFCVPGKASSRSGRGFLRSAEQALGDARAHGPWSIRAYSSAMHARHTTRTELARELEAALLNGQIAPWFQPQIRTDTGAVSGMEALARWSHPDRGLIPPSDFLPLIEDAGLSQRLGERILHGALAALQSWDRAGLHVPRVGVNFATGELRNPQLVEKVRWELDRFNLAPGRLTIEVLETVIASTADDTVVRNLVNLSKLGCGTDLDDFGTGHAAIGNIRRFSIQRVKIDRSFVTGVDRDPDQQNMVSAILLMAGRLGLDTLAEGVETAAEHGALARLGCRHVQGYGIARPMPEGALLRWLEEREKRLPSPEPPTPSPGLPGTFTASEDSGKTP